MKHAEGKLTLSLLAGLRQRQALPDRQQAPGHSLLRRASSAGEELPPSTSGAAGSAEASPAAAPISQAEKFILLEGIPQVCALLVLDMPAPLHRCM